MRERQLVTFLIPREFRVFGLHDRSESWARTVETRGTIFRGKEASLLRVVGWKVLGKFSAKKAWIYPGKSKFVINFRGTVKIFFNFNLITIREISFRFNNVVSKQRSFICIFSWKGNGEAAFLGRDKECQ